MSRTIDERVVSMQFDNKHFESNVKTTMSTLDKLKQSLNLSGASKGLDSINTAASKCNLSPLSKAAETVSVKFSAMEVMATTALANITNSAVNAGKRMVSALTIDPVKTGFSEYETQINAVQTIMANVGHKGKTLEDVTAALDELNEYADQTIYNFTEMTRNIGLFTNAGVGLDESVSAIKGFSNAAAMAGTDSTHASTAMYQLSQAMSSGSVKLLDWKSLETANITGERFVDTLKITARAHGIAIDEMVKKEGTFKNTLQDGWLTADLMSEALNHYTLSTEIMTEEEQRANRERLKSIGYTDEQIDKLFALGTEANNAATKVKTFSQLWGVLQESAQSGWAKTWQLIIGDFEEAKNLLTPLANFFTGVIDKFSETRNKILDSALGKGFTSLLDGVNSALNTTKDTVDAIIEPLEDLDSMVKKIMRGELGDGETRFNALSEAGYNWCKVQNKVNEAMGNNFRYTEDQIAEQDKLLGKQKESADASEEQATATTKLSDASKEQLKRLVRLDNEQLKNLNYTEEQIDALKGLVEQADKLGMPVDEFIDKIDEINGRWLLINSFKNVGQSLIDVFNAIKEAWQGIFPPKSIEDRANQLFNLIAAVHKFTSSLTGIFYENGKLTDSGDKLVRTLKGVFAIIDVITTVAGGAFKIAFKVLTQILGYFNMDILDLTAKIGDALVKFRDWFDSIFDISGVLDVLVPIIEKVADAVGKFVDKLKELWSGGGNILSKIGESLKTGFQNIGSAFSGLWGDAGGDIVSGLINGLKSGVAKVWEAAAALARSIWESFCNFLGIKSPSTKMEEAGEYAVDGLVNGLKSGGLNIVDVIKSLATRIIEAFKNLDLSKAAAVLTNLFIFFPKAGILKMAGAAMIIFNNLGMDSILGLKNGLASGAGSVISTVGDLISALVEKVKSILGINSPSKVFFAIGTFVVLGLIAGITALFPKARETLKNLATSLFEKLGSIGTSAGKSFGNIIRTIGKALGNVVSFIKENFGAIIAVLGGLGIAALALKLAKTVESIVTYFGMIPKSIAGLVNSVSGMFNAFGKAKLIAAKSTAVLKFAVAIGVLAQALIALSKLSWGEIGKGIAAIAGLAIVLGGFTIVMSKLVKSSDTAGLTASALVMLALAGSVLILVYALKKMDELNGENVWRNVAVIGTIAVGLVLVASLMSKLAPQMSKGAFAMIGIAAAVFILVSVLVKLNALTIDDPGKTIGALVALVGGLSLVALMSKGVKAGTAIGMIGMVIAIRMFISTLEKIAEMDINAIKNSMGTIITIMGLFAALMLATKLAGKNALKAGVGIIAISVALLLVIRAIKLLAGMDAATLENGLKAVTRILLLFAAVIALSYFAGKNAIRAGVMLIAMSAAILILVGAMALIALIKPDGLDRALDAVTRMMLLFAVLIAVSKFAEKSKGSLVALAVVIGILVAAVGIFSLIDPSKLKTAVGALSTIMLVLALLIASLKFVKTGKGDALKTISTLIVLTGVIAVIAWILKDLSDMANLDNALKAAGAISIVLIAIAAACFILSKANGIKAKTVGNAMLVAIILGEIALVLALCNALNVQSSLGNVLALTVLIEAVALACVILSKATGISVKTVGNAMLVAIILAEIALVLALCNALNVQSSLGNVLALSVLLEAVAVACVILSKAKGLNTKTAANAMLVAIILGEIALVLALCNALNVQSSLGNVLALTVLIEAVAAACFILSMAKGINTKTVANAMLVAIILGEIALVLALCNALNVQASLGNVLALTVLLEAVAVACVILSLCGSINAGAVVTMVVLGLVLAELALVLALCNAMNVQASIGTVLSLSILLIAMSVVTGILSLIGGAASSAIPAAASLMVVIAIIGGIALAIGGLMSLIPPESIEQWKTGLAAFMDFIVILAQGLGEAIGALVTGVLAGVGQGLSDFMTNLQGFIEGAKAIDPSICDAMTALAGAILALTGATVLDGISKLFGFGSFAEIGTSLSEFGSGMSAFAESISGLTEDDINKIHIAAEAGTAMAEMAKSVPREGGLWQKIAGEADLADFGAKMVAFGASMIAYSAAINTLTEEDITRVYTSADAGKAMTSLASSVPRQGGWWQKIAGTADLADFGLRMEAFGKSLVLYAGSISDLTSADVERINTSASLGEAMTGLEGSVPKQDGWWQDIAGESDIQTFGTRMEAFGTALVKYVTTVSELPDDAVDKINSSKTATEALLAVADLIPKSGGWGEAIGGGQDFSGFGIGMADVATGLKTYADMASGLDEGVADKIEATKPAIEALKKVYKVLPDDWSAWTGVDSMGSISTFASGMVEIGNALKEYAAVAVTLDESDITAIANSGTAIESLAKAAKQIPNEGGLASWISGDNNEFGKFGDGMCSLVTKVVDYAGLAIGLTEDKLTAIENSKLAIIAMATAANSLGNEGGLISLGWGDNTDPTAFGDGMCSLISKVIDYADVALGLTEDKVTAIENSKLAINAMATAANSLGNEGGAISLAWGDNVDPSKFGDGMCALITSVVSYGTTALGLTEDKIEAIGNSEKAISAMTDAAHEAQSLASIDLGSISATVTELENLAEAAKKLSDADFSGIGSIMKGLESGIDVNKGTVVNSMSKLAQDMVDGIKSKAGMFSTQGSVLMTKLAAGIFRAKSTVTEAVSDVLSGVFENMTYVYMDWYHVGTYLVDGFASGISARTWKAKAQSAAMAQAALKAAKDALDVNSPSKEFRKLGHSVPEGFALGVGDMGNSVKKAAENMAKKAIENMRGAISKILDVINLDFDSQPTISPVLDLDNVTAGMDTLNGMFGTNPSIDLLGNVGSISSMMNRNQNGGFDIASEIRGLGDKIGSSSGDTYIINGLTYEDGSAAANAVADLVRATNIGRRR